MQDTYYQRSEVSNSDLTELKNLLYPRTQYGDKEKAFKFGSLIDAMITEPERVRYDKRMVDDILYSGEDWELAEAMKKSLRMEARHDPFLAQVLAKAETQRFMVNKNQCFQYGNFKYTLDTRCKWDWWLPTYGFGGDLKSTFASTQKQFDEAIDFLIGTVPAPGIWISQAVGRISSMVSPRKIKKCSKHSLNEAIRFTRKVKKNTKNLPSGGGCCSVENK